MQVQRVLVYIYLVNSMVLEYFNYMYITICTYFVNSMVIEYFEFCFYKQ
jgi:hypothetical protein